MISLRGFRSLKKTKEDIKVIAIPEEVVLNRRLRKINQFEG
jgi:hypothetical protein